MGKKYKHWCDKEHTETESQFDTGILAHNLASTLTDWLMADFTIIDGMSPYQIDLQRSRMLNIIHTAEKLEATIKDANAIYAIYPCDWEERRIRWLRARCLCFDLTTYITHIVNYVEKDTNIQKYLRLESDIVAIGKKIKNVMIADDQRRKSKAKDY